MSNVKVDGGGGRSAAAGNTEKLETPTNKETTGSVMDVLNVTNSILAILIIYVLYKLFGPKKRIVERTEERERFILPDPLPKHDMTLDELRKYDGKGPDKRICIAILGRVYDCTKGYDYYGPGGAYSTFAGRDASRALAKFDVMAVKDEWDDISDLEQHEMSAVAEWNEQFQEKYDYVGRLVRSQEEILERPDFDEEEQLSRQQQTTDRQEQTNNNGKSSTTTDDEIEVINSEEAAPSTTTTNKKVSFIEPVTKEPTTKSNDSSDEIEVIGN